MKTILTAIASLLFLLSPTPGFPAYVIHLHDGTQFVTDQYFGDGDQIKFRRYAGLISIQKDLISAIGTGERGAKVADGAATGNFGCLTFVL
jgi:hypothetical protein